MLILLGIDSEFGTLEASIGQIRELGLFPKKTLRKEIYTGLLVSLLYSNSRELQILPEDVLKGSSNRRFATTFFLHKTRGNSDEALSDHFLKDSFQLQPINTKCFFTEITFVIRTTIFITCFRPQRQDDDTNDYDLIMSAGSY